MSEPVNTGPFVSSFGQAIYDPEAARKWAWNAMAKGFGLTGDQMERAIALLQQEERGELVRAEGTFSWAWAQAEAGKWIALPDVGWEWSLRHGTLIERQKRSKEQCFDAVICPKLCARTDWMVVEDAAPEGEG